MTKFFKAVSFLILPLIFVTSCSKVDQVESLGVVVEPELNQQIEIPELDGFSLELYQELLSSEYDDPVEGFGWRNERKRKEKVLKDSIKIKWRRLIQESGKSREELKPLFDANYYYNQERFKNLFLWTKFNQLRNIVYFLDDCRRNGDSPIQCNLKRKKTEDYTCRDLENYRKIKDYGIWDRYDIDIYPDYEGEKPDDHDYVKQVFGWTINSKSIFWSNGEFPYLRKLKFKEITLDHILKEYSNYSRYIENPGDNISTWEHLADHIRNSAGGHTIMIRRHTQILIPMAFNIFESEVLKVEDICD